MIRIVRGEPTEEELAALVAVLLARRRPAPPSPATAGPSPWTRSGRVTGPYGRMTARPR